MDDHNELRQPIKELVKKYELKSYTELAKRMDDLMHECNLNADYNGAKEAKIKRNCYNRVVKTLKRIIINMEELEIKHWAAYLPYGVKVKTTVW